MRGFLAGVLIVLGVLLVPIADLGVWTQRELLSTDHFTTLATDVMQQDEVTEALANRLADILEQQVPQLGVGRFILVPALKQVIGSEQFQTIFRSAVADMHTQLDRGDNQLTLNLDAVLPLVKSVVANVDEGLAARIPERTGIAVITVVTRENVPQLWFGVDVARKVSWAAPLASLLLIAGGVAVAKRRAVALILAGIGVMAVALLVVLAITAGREPLSSVAGRTVDLRAFDAGYGVVTDTLVLQSAVLGILGLFAVVIGITLAVLQRSRPEPTPWA